MAERYRYWCDKEAAHQAGCLDFLHDGARFNLVGLELLKNDLLPLAVVGPELFAAALDVVLDDGVRRLKDDVRGAIVLLQLDDLHFAEEFLEIEQV